MLGTQRKNKYLVGLLSTLSIAAISLFSPSDAHAANVPPVSADDEPLEEAEIMDEDYWEDALLGEGTPTVNTSDDSNPLPPEEDRKAVFEWLRHYYPALYQETVEGHDVTLKWYKGNKPNWRTVPYGSVAAVREDTPDQTNVNGEWRYVGFEYDGIEYAENPRFHFDECTIGTIVPRDVTYKPFTNTDSKINSTFRHKVRNTKYDTLASLANELQKNSEYIAKLADDDDSGDYPANRYYSPTDAAKLRLKFSDMLYDKYADPWMIQTQGAHSSCYKRGRYGGLTENHIQIKWSNRQERIDNFHVATMPTEMTSGTAYEFHKTKKGKAYYDSFRLTNAGFDFEAKDLKITNVATILSSVRFTVKNISGQYVDTKKTIYNHLSIKEGSNFVMFFDDTYIPKVDVYSPKWNTDESKTATLLDNINMNDYTMRTLTFKATFNKKKKFTELDYSNNSITKNFTLEPASYENFKGSCFLGYIGTAKQYAYVKYDSNGNPTCRTAVATLAYGVETSTIKAQYRGIIGMWSSNTKGHYLHREKIGAKDAKTEGNLIASSKLVVVGTTSPNITKTAITDFKVAGVEKLGKVIRAGRAIEYNTSIVYVITAQSFSSMSDAKNRARKFYTEMHKSTNFVTRGVNTSPGTNKMLLQFNGGNKRNTEAPAMRDTRRLNTPTDGKLLDSYSEKLGDVSCTQITRYTAKFEWKESITTKNLGGKQKIQKGDFSLKEDYDIGTNARQLYTSPDNPDGIYSLYIRNYFNPQNIDSAIPQDDEKCDSLPDLFIIQGNIYDDVRSKDVTSDFEIEDL